MNLIQQLEQEEVARLSSGKSIPEFQPGDTLLVNVKVVEGERTRIHANTIQAPDVVDDEFDHSETTSKKPRPDGLDDHDGGDGGGGESSEAN